jgi:probable F420-dependent oxidoreductase
MFQSRATSRTAAVAAGAGGHGGSVEIGVTIHSTDRSMSPVELAHEAEARGFHSLYIPEHTHIPTSRRTPPPTGDAELAEEYLRSLDPYVALAAAASLTSRIRLGTGIALVAQHDAIALAKQVATLDLLSGGRFVLGIGYGWNREEMENHGIDVRRRRERVRETLLAMQALWSREVAEFHGEFVHFEPSWQWPKPLQQPRPRVLIGGAAGPTLVAHVAEYADGWMPIGGGGVREALPLLRRAFEERGRDPGTLCIVPLGIQPDPAKLAYYEEIGVSEAVLRLPSAPREHVLPVLDAFTKYLP